MENNNLKDFIGNWGQEPFLGRSRFTLDRSLRRSLRLKIVDADGWLPYDDDAMPVQYRVPVVITREGKHFVAYSPALDLATSARTHKDAVRRFHEAAGIFFKELEELGTTNEVLGELGWQRVGGQPQPPVVVSTDLVDVPALRRSRHAAKTRAR